MTSSIDSLLPLNLPPRAVLTAGLACLLVGGTATVATAEVALEVGSDSARIWQMHEAPESVRLDPDFKAREAIAAEGGFVITGEDRGTGDLFVLRHEAGSTIGLPTPGGRSGPLRTAPRLLALGDRMEGITWLEGSHQNDFSIRAAAWNGTSWETGETISAPTGRAQLAPSATVLEDGSWLVVWAGFDGEDDEIFWSLRRDGVWSRPRRLHPDNAVPDVLPTVAADGELALAAWSWFDGADYRIQTARFNGAGWDLGAVLDARGTDRADIERVQGRSFLSFRSVAPEGWILFELDPDGATLLDVEPELHAERPLISVDGNEAARLSWPWRAERPLR